MLWEGVGGGARGRDDGRVHSHGREPHVAAPIGARAGVGQPVLLRQRGTAWSFESNWGVLWCGTEVVGGGGREYADASKLALV